MKTLTRTVWKKCALMVFLTLGLIGNDDSYGQSGERAQNLSPSMRLFYWYNPRSVEHIEQLEVLRKLADRKSEFIEFQSLIPPVVPTSRVNFTPVLSAFLARRGTPGDYAVLLTEYGHIHAQGSGAHMEQLLQSLPKELVSTDIDESTWGKVKELFQ
tara:strand:- start:2435 stop:2905 length:471 start_codon:yes stop_codon:yes gene_type:complete